MVHQIARWGRQILLKLKMIWRHWGVNTCSAWSLPVLCLRAIASPRSRPHRSVICVLDKNVAESAQNKNGWENEPLARTCREASPPIRDDWMECVPLPTARTLHHFIRTRQHIDWHAYRNPTPPMPNIHKHAQIYTNSLWMQFYGIQMESGAYCHMVRTWQQGLPNGPGPARKTLGSVEGTVTIPIEPMLHLHGSW